MLYTMTITTTTATSTRSTRFHASLPRSLRLTRGPTRGYPPSSVGSRRLPRATNNAGDDTDARQQQQQQRQRRVSTNGPREGDRVGDREDPDLYIGTYSNFFSDPEQIKGVLIFCAFLLSFFSLGNIGAALLLPQLYGTGETLGDFCLQSLIFGYYCN